MSNMSYCRFENTNHDLADCEVALSDLFDYSPNSVDDDEQDNPALSESELQAAKNIVARCVAIILLVADYGLLSASHSDDLDEVMDKYESILDKANEVASTPQEERAQS